MNNAGFWLEFLGFIISRLAKKEIECQAKQSMNASYIKDKATVKYRERSRGKEGGNRYKQTILPIMANMSVSSLALGIRTGENGEEATTAALRKSMTDWLTNSC